MLLLSPVYMYCGAGTPYLFLIAAKARTSDAMINHTHDASSVPVHQLSDTRALDAKHRAGVTWPPSAAADSATLDDQVSSLVSDLCEV